MNDQPLSPAAATDDWLDAVLHAEGREHRAAYLDDAGFTARVMASLPAPAAMPAWRKPALALLWAVAGFGIALSLPAALVDVGHDVVRLFVGHRVSLAGIAAGVVALGAATWVAAALALREEK
jgi:hypothetical protein